MILGSVLKFQEEANVDREVGATVCTVPTGLRLNGGSTHPALKRGANKLCAYGAGRLAAAGMKRCCRHEALLSA